MILNKFCLTLKDFQKLPVFNCYCSILIRKGIRWSFIFHIKGLFIGIQLLSQFKI